MITFDANCHNCKFMNWITKTRGKGLDTVTSVVGVECIFDPNNPIPLPHYKICIKWQLFVIDPEKLPVEFARKVAVILEREEQAKKLANSR